MRRYAIPISFALAAAGLLLAAAPSAAAGHGHPVLATDLFPVDNWVGDGLKKAKDIVFGGISLSADAVAQLLVTVLATLVNLLIPHSFVDAGMSAIKWLCTVPSFSGQQVGTTGSQLNLPHVDQLRQTLTWIGVCTLPLGLVYAGGRSVMTPSAYGDSPQEVLGRVVIAAAWLAFYVWGWQSITHFSGLVSNGVLSLPWVDDGVQKLMGGLALVSGSLGPISEFAVLVLGFFVGLALIALLVMKIGLLVITAFLFAIGGLIGALYPLPFGRKLVGGYVIAVVAVVALPALWAVVFALAAALMVDAHNAGGGGFNAFIAQFWVLGASLATFALALKLGFSAFGFASSTITSFTAGALLGGAGSGGGGGSPSATQTAHKAHSLYSAGSSGAARIGGARSARRAGWPHRWSAAHARARRGASRSGRLERRGEDRRDRRSGGRDRRRERGRSGRRRRREGNGGRSRANGIEGGRGACRPVPRGGLAAEHRPRWRPRAFARRAAATGGEAPRAPRRPAGSAQRERPADPEAGQPPVKKAPAPSRTQSPPRGASAERWRQGPMSDGDPIRSEVTPNYRTLDEPTKLLGLSIGQWGAVALAAGFAYLLLLVSPLPWRVNVSLIVIFGGAPMVLLLLREQGALSASQLVGAVCRWRATAGAAAGGRRRAAAERRRRRARRGPRRDRR